MFKGAVRLVLTIRESSVVVLELLQISITWLQKHERYLSLWWLVPNTYSDTLFSIIYFYAYKKWE